MNSTLRKLASASMLAALVALLALVGCGHRQNNVPPQATELVAPELAAEVSPPLVNAADPGTVTNEPSANAQNFAQTLQDSPFASAEPALKETYARALIAFQIEDYARSLDELNSLNTNAELTAQQRAAVQDLLEKTKTAAPKPPTNTALTASNNLPLAYALAAPADEPFSTADPAVAETYKRAKAAFEIGDYASAVPELKDLVAHPQLNWQQKYEAQVLLDKASLPAGR